MSLNAEEFISVKMKTLISKTNKQGTVSNDNNWTRNKKQLIIQTQS